MPPMTKDIEAAFAQFPEEIASPLLHIRDMLYHEAEQHGKTLSEDIKWGQPSFCVKGGTPLRLGQPKKVGYYAIYVHCQTNLVQMFQHIYPDLLYEGNRAVLFDKDAPFLEAEMRHLIALAFNYHQK